MTEPYVKTLANEPSPPKEKKFAVIEIFGPTLQGEGPLAGSKTMFVRFGGCDYRCAKCIEKSQRVLMADWSLKPISQIQIGDMVLGMQDSYNLTRKKLVPTKVLAKANQGTKPLVRVSTTVAGESSDKKGAYKGTAATSLLCTADHKLLNVKWRTDWLEAQKASGAVLRAVETYTPTDAFWEGWLHGAMQGDGNIHKFQDTWWRMKLSCSDEEIRDKAFELLSLLDAPNPRKVMHNPGNGKTLLPSVEVTTHEWVEQFKEVVDKGSSNPEYCRGWLAGFFDTDGHYDNHTTSVRISQSILVNQHKIDRCIEYAERLGFEINHQQNGRMQTLIISHCMEFFTRCPPLLKRKYPAELRIGKMPRAPVKSIEEAGEGEVWDITTETGNFIAEGIIVHNCDSMHAVLPAAIKANAEYIMAQEIADRLIPTAIKTGTQWVTLSGGNPCMWDLTELINILQGAGLYVCLETQGTLAPSWLPMCNLIVVSPKSPGMGEKFEPTKFSKFLQATHNEGFAAPPTALKIVIFSQQDIDFALDVEALAGGYILTGMHFFSLGNSHPPVVTEENASIEVLDPLDYMGHLRSLMSEYRLLTEDILVDRRISHWKFLPQLHVLAYGNKAGV